MKKVYNKYYSFNYKLLILSGSHLGGNVQNFDLSNSSVIYGIRTSNVVINLVLASLELVKSFKIFESCGFNRSTVYYVNSSFASRSAVRFHHQFFNLHLGKSMKVKIIKYSRLYHSTFYVSKWPNGFLGNRGSFAKYAHRLYINMNLKRFYKLNYFFDHLPRRALAGVLTNINNNILKEFLSCGVPCVSLGDVFVASTQSDFLGSYKLPSNACSFQVSQFYISICLAAHIYGYYKLVVKFNSVDCNKKIKTLKLDYNEFFFHNKVLLKKKLFFKKFFFLKLLIN